MDGGVIPSLKKEGRGVGGSPPSPPCPRTALFLHGFSHRFAWSLRWGTGFFGIFRGIMAVRENRALEGGASPLRARHMDGGVTPSEKKRGGGVGGSPPPPLSGFGGCSGPVMMLGADASMSDECRRSRQKAPAADPERGPEAGEGITSFVKWPENPHQENRASC